MSKKRIYPISLIVVFSLLFLFKASKVPEYDFPLYRVVIDPGHGGVSMKPRNIYGDRYDKISGTYLDDFKEGAARGRLWEHKIVYQISKKALDILLLCGPDGNFQKFRKILKKYTDQEPGRIYILPILSRGKSATRKDVKKNSDLNGEFRLFDYPDKKARIMPGRISRINQFRPQLVVSLHFAGSGPREYKGMNPVLVAPHSLLAQGLEYLQGKRKGRSFFHKNRMNDWFKETVKRTAFQWFLNDTSLYFSGYPLDRKNRVKSGDFRGYRYNMVTWEYQDAAGWEKGARYHCPDSRYSSDLKTIKVNGKFWQREKSKFEKFRREGGMEGYGGDNAYASYEIIRYMLAALKKNGTYNYTHQPGKSYVSTWILPLHVNAISAFIELGYLNRWRDRRMLVRKQNELAEGIAVGIYSLLAGLEPRDKKFKYAPKGKRIDLEKYQISTEKSYFDIVTGD